MSNENENQVVEVEKKRGPSGEVGKPTAGLAIKQMWSAAMGEIARPSERTSLKQFARALAKSGDATAKSWLAHKHGSLNQKRTEETIARIRAEKSCVRTGRKGHKKGSGGKKGNG